MLLSLYIHLYLCSVDMYVSFTSVSIVKKKKFLRPVHEYFPRLYLVLIKPSKCLTRCHGRATLSVNASWTSTFQSVKQLACDSGQRRFVKWLEHDGGSWKSEIIKFATYVPTKQNYYSMTAQTLNYSKALNKIILAQEHDPCNHKFAWLSNCA